MSKFESALAPYMDGLIAQKRALGFQYYEQENQLMKFDAMLMEKYPECRNKEQTAQKQNSFCAVFFRKC